MSECVLLRAEDQRKAKVMTRVLRNPLIRLGVLVVIVNAALLFIVMPELSGRLHPFYNQDLYADGYDQLAANLAAGNGYRFYPETARTLMREPGYPVLLAAILLVFGKSFTAVKATNMCLALVTAWLMTLIARRLSSNQTMVLVPPLLFLFHPGTLIAESRGGVEVLFTFLVVLFMGVLYRAVESSRWLLYAMSGAVLGLAVLVKSTPLLFPLFLLAYLVMVERKPKPAVFGHVALLIIAMFAVLSPWIIRNYSLTRRFIPTASVLGVSAQAGQYICTHRTDHKAWWLLDREAALERGNLARELGYRFRIDYYYQTFYSTDDELSFSSYLMKRVIGEYKRAPLLCLKCMGNNLFNFWFAGKTWESTSMSLVVQVPYLILGIAGVVLSVRNGQTKVIGPLVLFIIYFVGVYVPILAQARYSMPLVPFVSILAVVTLVAARENVANFCARHMVIGRVDRGSDKRSRVFGFVHHQKEKQ